jgi:predicted MFS family arabinose efflux permease
VLQIRNIGPFVVLYSLDFLLNGVQDTTKAVMPLYLATVKAQKKKLQSKVESLFQLGNLGGPFVVQMFLLAFGEAAVSLCPPIFFLCCFACYVLIQVDRIPNWQQIEEFAAAKSSSGAAGKQQNTLSYLRSKPIVLAVFMATATVQFYRLKSVLPSIYAVYAIGDEQWIALLSFAFGLGSCCGSIASYWMTRHLRNSMMLCVSACGLLLFAVCWTFASFVGIFLSIFVFSFVNGVGIVVVQTRLQFAAEEDKASFILASSRFLIRMVSLAGKMMILATFGLKDATGLSAQMLFVILTFFFGLVALVEIAVAAWLRKKDPLDDPRS